MSDPGSAGRNSEMDAQMGGFDRQRETGKALRDPQPRLDLSDGTPRDEYFTVMKFEGQELGWFRKEMGREVFRLASPTGRSLGALLVPESGAFVVRSEDMLRAYDAAFDRRYAQFGLDLEGFRKDVGASREVETFRRDMERGAHQDGRYHGLVYDPASGGFRAETWDKEPPKRVYGEREVLVQRDRPGDRTEKQPGMRAMEERLTLSYVKERMGPVEERLERATREFESALHEQAGLVKEYLAELKGGRAKETVDELVYDMKNARFERSAWNKAPEKGTRGEDKVLLGRFGGRATGGVRTRGDGRIV